MPTPTHPLTQSTSGTPQVVEHQQDVDDEVDQQSVRLLNRYFVFLGMAMFVALALCFCGIMERVYNTNIVLSRPYSVCVLREAGWDVAWGGGCGVGEGGWLGGASPFKFFLR